MPRKKKPAFPDRGLVTASLESIDHAGLGERRLARVHPLLEKFAGSDDGLVQFDLRDRRRCGDRGPVSAMAASFMIGLIMASLPLGPTLQP
jgi:hypothetical protein